VLMVTPAKSLSSVLHLGIVQAAGQRST
jgi:hypothetical protein